jgi:hypothetical protein
VARRVSVSHDSDGHSRLVAEGPIHQIQRLAAAVDAAAHVLPAAGRSVAQRRFDALVAMAAGVLDEVATGDRLAGRAGIVVRGSADTLDRLRGAKRGADTADDSSADEAEPAQDARTARPRKRSKETESAELAGYGPIPDSLARMLLMDRHASVLVTGISQPVCDHSGGYAIPDGLVSAVLALHPRCAFPGCTISSHRADLDHVVPYPTGPTCACNLVPLCRSHHRLKTNGGWRLVLRPGRLAAWRSPLGRRYIVHPSGETDVDMAVA